MRSERLALHERLEAVAARYDLAAIERDGRARDHWIELSRILRIPRNVDEPHRRDRLELVIERLGVANHDNGQSIAPEHTLRCGAGAPPIHSGEALPIPLQVVRAETEQSRGRHDRGDLPWRLDCKRERANEESLGRIELAIGNDRGADPVQLRTGQDGSGDIVDDPGQFDQLAGPVQGRRSFCTPRADSKQLHSGTSQTSDVSRMSTRS